MSKLELSLNDCTDIGDLVMIANEEAVNELLEEADIEDDIDYDEYIDDDVYDAAIDDLYEDGVGIGDIEAEEMSYTVSDIVNDELEDMIYDTLVSDENIDCCSEVDCEECYDISEIDDLD